MKRILLIGNPNVGKSTLFNALTGGRAKVGNWHGVTVGALSQKAVLDGQEVEICDLPGIYSLSTYSLEEGLTREYITAQTEDVALFVAECQTLERCLPLLREVAKARPTCLVLTKRKAFERQGGRVSCDLLSETLGIPVFTADTGRGEIAVLRNRLAIFLKHGGGEMASNATLSEAAYRPARVGLSRADRLFFNGFFCVGAFLLVLVTTFYLTFAPNMLGSLFKGAIEGFFCEFLAGKAQAIVSPVLKSFLIDGVLRGVGGVLCFLPQIAMLFFSLSFLEESGFLSRLAVHTDGIFSKLGLNGRAVFSLLMGFGCTAAAILTTRGLEDKRVQRRAILCLPYLPCSAKLPVFLTLSASFFANPFWAALLLYALGVGIAIAVSLLLNREKSPPFALEIAPLQIPSPIFLFKALRFQLKQFIIKTATVILAFFLLSWLLSSFNFTFRFCTVEESMLASLCGWLKYLFAPIGCCDWKIAYAALSGLIAKENVAGILTVFYGGFPYSAESAFAFAIFILTCSPCVSAITATAREVGKGRAIGYALLQTLSALLLSYVTYCLLLGGWFNALLLCALLLGGVILGKIWYEKVHRKRKNNVKTLHR